MRDSHVRRPRLLELFFGLAALGGAGLVTFGAQPPPASLHSSHPPPGLVAFRPNPRPLPGALGPVAVSGTINGAAQNVACPVGDQGTVTCQITGTWVATLIFEATVDNLTWATVRANAIASDTLVTAPAADGLYVLAGNFTAVRVRDSAYTSGSAVVTMRATPSSSANVPVSSVGGTGGGGGGGAATIADGADVTQGALADAAVGDAAGTLNSHLRQIAKTLATAVPVTGTFFQATQPVSGTVTITPSGTQTVSGTVAATQSGTWTVQPGNTANTTAWKVDGSAVTQPVSGTVTITPSGTQTITGTVANSAGVATIGNVGGLTQSVSTTLTRVANTTTYTAGDEMTDVATTIKTISGAALATGGSGIITHCYMSCSSNTTTTKPTFTVFVYDTTSTPGTDNLAFAPTSAVQDTGVGTFTLSGTENGDATNNTGNYTMDSGQIHIPFVTSGSANLFFRVKVTNAYTPGASSDTYRFRFTIQEDAK